MVLAVMQQVTSLAEGMEVAQPTVGEVVVEMGSGEHHASAAQAGYLN